MLFGQVGDRLEIPHATPAQGLSGPKPQLCNANVLEDNRQQICGSRLEIAPEKPDTEHGVDTRGQNQANRYLWVVVGREVFGTVQEHDWVRMQ